MALDRKSVHVRLDPELHKQLALMADFRDRDIAELAAQWLEKLIVGEFHDFRLAADRYARLGLSGSDGFSEGLKGKRRDDPSTGGGK